MSWSYAALLIINVFKKIYNNIDTIVNIKIQKCILPGLEMD